MLILEDLYNTLQETSIFEFIVKTIEEVRESFSHDEEDDNV